MGILKTTRKTNTTSRVASLFGSAASTAATIPSSIMSGVSLGIESGKEQGREQKKEFALIKLMNVKHLGSAIRDAKKIDDFIKSSKTKRKNLAVSGLDTSEYKDALDELNKTERELSQKFNDIHGISYNSLTQLIENFDNDDDFISYAESRYQDEVQAIEKHQAEVDKEYKQVCDETTKQLATLATFRESFIEQANSLNVEE